MSADLSFEVIGAKVEPYAAVATITLRLRVTEKTGITVHALALRGQVRIEPQRRRYESDEEGRLLELFGKTTQWGDTLKPFLWTHVSTVVNRFTDSVEIDLPLVCSYDMDVAAPKYLHSLDGGEIPIMVLFNGTVFSKGTTGLAAEPVAWSAEASYRLPVKVWRDAMDLYFPGGGYLRLDRDTIDALGRIKAEHALPTWDQTVNLLLKKAGED